jgi:hypothetical protein
MKKILSLLILLALTLGIAYVVSAKDVSFTQDDRDRLIRLEEGIKATNQRIDATNQRIDTLTTFMLWGFGILFGGMGMLMGFVIWDRRTALAPAVRKNKELEEREEAIEKALREYAKVEPKFAEILKSVRFR